MSKLLIVLAIDREQGMLALASQSKAPTQSTSNRGATEGNIIQINNDLAPKKVKGVQHRVDPPERDVPSLCTSIYIARHKGLQSAVL